MSDVENRRETAHVLPATMTAAVYDRYGPPEQVVRVQAEPLPTPDAPGVLVQVAAASVNALDWHYVTGLPMLARAVLGLRRPKRRIPGVDVAGTVVAVGDAVTRFRVGDEVFGRVDGGGFAEYAATPRTGSSPSPPTSAWRRPPRSGSPPRPPSRVCATGGDSSPDTRS